MCHANQDRTSLNRRRRWVQHTARRINIRWPLGQIKTACLSLPALQEHLSEWVEGGRWADRRCDKQQGVLRCHVRYVKKETFTFVDLPSFENHSQVWLIAWSTWKITNSVLISADGKCEALWNAWEMQEVLKFFHKPNEHGSFWLLPRSVCKSYPRAQKSDGVTSVPENITSEPRCVDTEHWCRFFGVFCWY